MLARAQLVQIELPESILAVLGASTGTLASLLFRDRDPGGAETVEHVQAAFPADLVENLLEAVERILGPEAA